MVFHISQVYPYPVSRDLCRRIITTYESLMSYSRFTLVGCYLNFLLFAPTFNLAFHLVSCSKFDKP